MLDAANTPRSYIVQAGTEELKRNRAHLHAQPELSVPAPETPGLQRETTSVQPELSVRMPRLQCLGDKQRWNRCLKQNAQRKCTLRKGESLQEDKSTHQCGLDTVH